MTKRMIITPLRNLLNWLEGPAPVPPVAPAQILSMPPSIEESLEKIANYWTDGTRSLAVRLSEVLITVKGVIVDVDETLIFIEAFQLDAWLYALEQMVRVGHKIHSKDPEQKLEELRNIIRRAFRDHYFKDMLEAIRFMLLAYQWLPQRLYDAEKQMRLEGIAEKKIEAITCSELEQIFIQYRLEYLKKKVDEIGASRLVLPGALEFLRECKAAGLKLGLYTNTPSGLASHLLPYILGSEIDELIPEQYRVYGDQVGSRRKPMRDGWDLCAKALGVPIEQIAIVDDRSPAVFEAIKNNGSPAFGWGIVIAGLHAGAQDIIAINTALGGGQAVANYSIVNVLGEVGV